MKLTHTTLNTSIDLCIRLIGYPFHSKGRTINAGFFALVMAVTVVDVHSAEKSEASEKPETSAQSGALAIKATPANVDIYINEALRADTTPVVVRLPVGRHTVDIHHHNKRPLHFDVLITSDSVIVKTVALEDLPPEERTLLNPEELMSARRDSFETQEQFNNRLNRYLEQFNRAANVQDPAVQAGVVILDKNKYDIKSQCFLVAIEWRSWLSTLSLPTYGLLHIKPDEARRLWQEGTHKPVFVDLAPNPSSFNTSSSNHPSFSVKDTEIVGLDRLWTLQIRHPQLLAGNVFRDILQIGLAGPEMVVIPAGRFRMGDLTDETEAETEADTKAPGDQESAPLAGTPTHPSTYPTLAAARPVRTVIFDKPFALGRYVITFDDYDPFAKATSRPLPADQGWGRGRLPVINVSWDDAHAYTVWLSEQTGQRYRLPSEAEWEYAARAGTETHYWWGNELVPDMANCDTCTGEWAGHRTVPVGSFPANPFGLFDVHGNVSEWVADCWHDHYRGAPVDGSVWDEPSCTRRVWRSGSWSSQANLMRAASRSWGVSTTGRNRIGFRVAQTLFPPIPAPAHNAGVTP